jgi:heptosyltransferase-2
MRSKRFDLIVDLRNSMLPFLLNAGTVTFPSLRPSKVHMKQKHLKRLKLVLNDLPFDVPRSCVPSQKGMNIDRWLSGMKDYVVVAPGAADQRKRWGEEGFLQVVVHILRRGRKVVLVGDQQDALVAARIVASAGKGVVDLCGKTNLAELAAVVGRASFAVTNDSGIMHLLSYANKPVLALFGPTDPFFYGPWSDRSLVIRHDADMASISVEEVLRKVDGLL